MIIFSLKVEANVMLYEIDKRIILKYLTELLQTTIHLFNRSILAITKVFSNYCNDNILHTVHQKY